MNNVKKELKKRLINNNFKPIKITMKCNNDVLTITPCSQNGEIKNIEDVEYYLVHSSFLPWLGGDTLDEIATQILTYQQTLKSLIKRRDELKKFYQEKIEPHKNDENWLCQSSDFQTYSDWHKELYGHRPHL